MIKIKCFGVTRDIIKNDSWDYECSNEILVSELKGLLEERFPALGELKQYLVAVNHEYAEDSLSIKSGDEVALIPPVSGG